MSPRNSRVLKLERQVRTLRGRIQVLELAADRDQVVIRELERAVGALRLACTVRLGRLEPESVEADLIRTVLGPLEVPPPGEAA